MVAMMRMPGMRFGAAALIAAAALLAAAAGRASAAAAAPSATTGPVSQIGSSSATATETVNPGGQSTTWYFEYGTSTSYGSKSATSSAGNGTAGVDVSAVLGNLSPGTTYHYRLVASNATGTDRGGDG